MATSELNNLMELALKDRSFDFYETGYPIKDKISKQKIEYIQAMTKDIELFRKYVDKENEYSNRATLYVKGRDIQPVEMQIEFNDCKWELVSIMTQEEIAAANTPEVIHNLVDFIKERRAWRGSATELLNELGDQSVGANVITKYVNQYKGSLLLDEGIVYDYSRTHADGRILSFEICDSCDGCDSKEDNSR